MPKFIPSLLRSSNPEEEDAFREFLDPTVSLKMAVFFASPGVVVLIVSSLVGEERVFVRISPIIFFVCTILQCYFAFKYRKRDDCGTKVHWLFKADFLLLFFKLWLSVLWHEITRDIREDGCPDRFLLFKRHSAGPYREANCERLLQTHDVLTTVLLVVIRQRFAHVVVSSVVTVAWLLAYLPVSSQHDAFPGLRGIEIVFVAGALSLCCYIRYLLEVTDRAQFKTQQELQRYHAELRSVSEELSKELKVILPGKVLERSSSSTKNLLKADSGSEVVVLQAGFHDVNIISQSLTPMEAASAVSNFHSLAFELAEASKSLQRIHVLHDECLIVGNLLSRASPAKSLHEACSVAVSLVGIELKVVAAVHIGEASGAFSGTRFIRYDVRGPAIETCGRVMQLCGANEALVTEDVVHSVGNAITVSESTAVPAASSDESSPIATYRLGLVGDISSDMLLSSAAERGSNERSVSGDQKTQRSLDDVVLFDLSAATRVVKDGARVGAEKAEPDDQFEQQGVWCCFCKFVDESIEEEYLKDRAVRMLQRASAVWLAYAAFLLLVFVLVLSDLFETRLSSVAIVLLCLCVSASVGVAQTGLQLRQERTHKAYGLWSTCAILVPLGVVFAVAMARPSAIGNDIRPFVMIGALMRSPALLEARHQLIVIPVFLLLSQMHLFLPGAELRLGDTWAWGLVLFTISSDARLDDVGRQHFVNRQRVEVALELLGKEQKLRVGLARSQLPGPLLESVLLGHFDKDVIISKRIPDAIVTVVSLAWGTDMLGVGKSASGVLLSVVEDLERRTSQLHVVKIVGNVAVMTNVFMDTVEGDRRSGQDIEKKTLEALLQVAVVEHHPKCAVFADIDSVVESVSTAGLPSFDILGPAIGRLLSLRATGSFGSGVYVTDRVLANVHHEGMPRVNETLMPPVRIRGVGVVRMTKVTSS